MLERNLLYTAITRGKRLVVVIGQPQALAIAVNTVKAARRLRGCEKIVCRGSPIDHEYAILAP